MSGEFLVLLVFMLLGMGAYWSFVVFPKQREFAKRQKLVRALNVGDEVITYGGIIARVVAVEAETGVVQAEIAPNVTVRLVAAAVMQTYDAEEIARNARMSPDQPASEPSA